MTEESFLFGWCFRDAHEQCIDDSSKELPKRRADSKEGFEQLYCICECHEAQEKVMINA